MLTFSLGDNAISPIKSTVYAYTYFLKYHNTQLIENNETIILDTQFIFAHNLNEHLLVSLHSAVSAKGITLEMFSVDDNPLKESSVSINNRSLKLHLKNTSGVPKYITMGELLCEVSAVNIFTDTKLLISELNQVFASAAEINILDGLLASTPELNYVDITTEGTAEATKALVTNASSDIIGINILSSAEIGINQAIPAAQLHIKQAADDQTSGIRFEESTDTNYWGVFMDATDILQFHHNGADLGFVNTIGTDIAMNFTGQHRSSTENVLINASPENYIGKIVSATGNYKNMNGDELTVNDALPVVDLSSTENDKTVFGIISAKEDENETRTYQTGIFATYFEKETGDERLFINSVGEGMVWVCDKNGEFVNGDLITSSTVSGFGQLQNDDLMHSYTVAKITQNCDFTSAEKFVDAMGNDVDQAIYEADVANHYKCKFVGCTYHCG